MKTMIEHRTIRKYKNETIDINLLNSIIEKGCRASTTGNMQLYSIINTCKDNIKKELSPLHFNQAMVIDAPNVLTFCADLNRFNRWCRLNDAKPGYDNFLWFITAVIDAMLVAQNVALAAEDEGLGICYLGTTIYNAEEIINILELPKGVIPITTLTVGWPDENPALSDRLPLNAVLHSEKYIDYSDNDISMHYAEKEALQENKNFVLENNKTSLAQVFTDVRYKKEVNELFSKKLIEVIKKQGFNF